MRARILAPLVLALAACGDTLVDHRQTDIRDVVDRPDACLPGTASCLVDGLLTCPTDTVTRCGGGCEDCTATVTPPSGAEVACLPRPDVQSACGFQCLAGMLGCGSGCCGAVALAAGAAHSCAVSSDGRLLCWGRNAEGQVTGTPTASPVLAPHEVFAAGVTAVAAGTAHTCATVSGVVRCLGDNSSGEAPATRAVNAIELAAGDRHTCAREGDGSVTCWGASDLGQTGGGAPIASGATQITAGAEHTCALVAGGGVACWGRNGSGELGTGATGGPSALPQTPVGLGADVVDIAVIGAGAHHTCAANGTRTTPLLCWGGNATGTVVGELALQVLPGLGEPVQATPAEPQPGGGPVNYDVAKIGGGRQHTCVQRTGEGIKCFGADGAEGQLGGAPLPEDVDVAAVPFGAPVLAVGGDHACAVYPDGSVHCWGRNSEGQLGDGTQSTPAAGTVVAVGGR